MTGLIQDIRYALRQLRKSPGFTTVAVFTLGLGIGANTAIFSAVNAILLRPLPYADPGQLIAATSQDVAAPATLVALREQAKSADYAGYTEATEVNMTGQGEPVRLVASEVAANFFRVLGVGPLVGSDFRDGEDLAGHGHGVLLSYSLWKSRFNGLPDVVGRSLVIDDQTQEIIGVMPADFQFPSASTEIWIPIQIDPNDVSAYYFQSNLPIIGRLKQGATLAPARAEFKLVISRLQEQHYRRILPWWGDDASLTYMQDVIVKSTRAYLLILLGAVGLVLLIACANFTNLLVVRNAVRGKELAVRAALGADRLQTIKHVLVESLLLGLIGGAIGLLVAWLGTSVLISWFPANTPRIPEIKMDAHVLGFSAVLAIVSGLVFGLVPAFRASQPGALEFLRIGDRTVANDGKSLLGKFVILEIAVSAVIVVGAGLLLKSLWILSGQNPGFNARGVLTVKVTPPESVCKEHARCVEFYRQLLERVRNLPGVETSSASTSVPLSGEMTRFAGELEGHPWVRGTPVTLVWRWDIAPAYFETMGIPMLQGRGFTDSDSDAAEPVAIVSAATASKYWPGQNPIGKHIRGIWEKDWRRVVGVAGDVHPSALGVDPFTALGQAYFPFAHPISPGTAMVIALRTKADPLSMIGSIRHVIAETNPDVPLSHIQTMEEVVQNSISEPRSSMWLLTSFALLALLLGAVGIYGVISYAVTRRVREIGIRMALGSSTFEIRNLILGQSLRLAGIGLAIGFPAALAATRVIQSRLFEVKSTDPLTYVVGASLVLCVALLASYIPARRAAKVDPMVALRYE